MNKTNIETNSEVMNKTLTLDEVCAAIPAIRNPIPVSTISNKYKLIDTKLVLNEALNAGFEIVRASAKDQTASAFHHVTLVRREDLKNLHDIRQIDEGVFRLEVFNSHNRMKKFMLAVGYFRFVCSNGLIFNSGDSNQFVKIKHRFSDETAEMFCNQIKEFPNLANKARDEIQAFKNRKLTENEAQAFAQYAIDTRFRTRYLLPKRWKNSEVAQEKILKPRRDEDCSETLWHVFNRVQENFVKGIPDFSRPINSLVVRTDFNFNLWKGASLALQYEGDSFASKLHELVKERSEEEIKTQRLSLKYKNLQKVAE